jgi:excinuclease ABC subunit A
MNRDYIYVKGARQHNLQNIDVKIPRDKLVVLTGLSGSGKSSLAFDTIYAEGQRRYMESLSSYARQFLGQMEKPAVDSIEGLSPAIAIDQKTTNRNPRSTVGTVTEIHDYLRLLYARVGKPHCPNCGKPITQQTVDQIVDKLLSLPEGTKMQLLAPMISGRKGEFQKLFTDIKSDGYLRVRVDGEIRTLDEEIELNKKLKHSVEVVVDRLVVRDGIDKRLAESIEVTMEMSGGSLLVLAETKVIGDDGEEVVREQELRFNKNLACPDCGVSLDELTPRMFSFNNPYGACPSCSGLGFRMKVDPGLLIVNDELTLNEGALAHWSENYAGWYFRFIQALAQKYDFSLDVPLKDLTEEQLNLIFYGTGKEKISFEYIDYNHKHKTMLAPWEGMVSNLERRYQETTSDFIREDIERYMVESPCPDCHGARLKPEVLAVTLAYQTENGEIRELNIDELSSLTIYETQDFFRRIVLSEREESIVHMVLKEIRARLEFLMNVGLDYLTLSRAAGTLSGGEAQRIRLATQIGSSLVGVLYILDEPSIGLHQRDNDQLIATLKRLRDIGNTVIVVEHDDETMLAADYIVDIGPGAGRHGGKVVAEGTPQEIMACEDSITGRYLSGREEIPVPLLRRPGNGKFLKLFGCQENNLQKIDVEIPLGKFVCVTGVSGSGKSTLVNEILYKTLAQRLNHAHTKPGKFRKIEGLQALEKVIDIDQSPIGRTPRSNPATYTGVFSLIRDLFAQLPDAKMRGYKPGRFSFNVSGGRCEACKGDGIIKIEMHFLPDVYVPCEVCKGQRYNRETLDVKYKGKSIADVLEMTVDEAVDFFANVPRISHKLQVLQDVGLGYIQLGQSGTTLSGGEAQRVKLAAELSRRSQGQSFYILDEPTTGLHIADIKKLLEVLNRLVDAGNTVLVIEHNLDVIKCADYIIDLGPEGGGRGGRIVATGTPEDVVRVEDSYTGQYLVKKLPEIQ